MMDLKEQRKQKDDKIEGALTASYPVSSAETYETRAQQTSTLSNNKLLHEKHIPNRLRVL